MVMQETSSRITFSGEWLIINKNTYFNSGDMKQYKISELIFLLFADIQALWISYKPCPWIDNQWNYIWV